MTTEPLKFTINDSVYSYCSNGDGIPVVMLHGFTGSSATWEPFISKWGDRLRIITVDLPGHGQTNTASSTTVEACCRDLQKLFQHLKVSKIHLVGYSMGGRVALSFAMRYPDLIQSLTLESASPGIDSSSERVQRIKNDEKLAQRIEQEGIGKFVDFWENIPLFQTQKKLPEKIKQIIRNERLSQTESGLANSLRYMGSGVQPNWWDSINQFTKPVLLLAGKQDPKFIEINKKMAKRFAASTLTVVQNSGHAIHVEQPEIFGKLITEFIFLNK